MKTRSENILKSILVIYKNPGHVKFQDKGLQIA